MARVGMLCMSKPFVNAANLLHRHPAVLMPDCHESLGGGEKRNQHIEGGRPETEITLNACRDIGQLTPRPQAWEWNAEHPRSQQESELPPKKFV